MNTRNHGIIIGTEYQSSGAVQPARSMTLERLVPMPLNDNPINNSIPYGYCHCGCGEKTGIASQTDSAKGWTKGLPVSFVSWHHRRVSRPSDVEWDSGRGCYLVHLNSKKYPGRIALIDAEDIGIVSGRSWYPHLATSGSFYASSGKKGGKMHRIIMDAPAGFDVDHINHDTLDNRRANLRITTRSENVRNASKLRDTNQSGYVGTCWNEHMGMWQAQIWDGEKKRHLGYFDDRAEAAIAYDLAAIERGGDHMLLNFPSLLGACRKAKEQK